MKNFNEWRYERPLQTTPPTTTSATMQPGKKWKATKEQVMSYWQGLQPNMPLAMQPIPYEHEGSTYQQDGIRITGSKEFIASTIARLKEFMQYESAQTKLMVVFRQTERQSGGADDRVTYVFYIQAKDRAPVRSDDMGAPKPPKPKPAIKSPSPMPV
jgi:hypothetical protein